MQTTPLRHKSTRRAADMGRVLTEAVIENFHDHWAARKGQLPPREVRRLVVSDALVDTGATTLSLPKKLIRELGLEKISERRVRTTGGNRIAGVYGTVLLTIMGRTCTLDVMDVPNSIPVLIGQIPLELLDFVVDPVAHRLIGNPAHGGEHILEAY